MTIEIIKANREILLKGLQNRGDNVADRNSQSACP